MVYGRVTYIHNNQLEKTWYVKIHGLFGDVQQKIVLCFRDVQWNNNWKRRGMSKYMDFLVTWIKNCFIFPWRPMNNGFGRLCRLWALKSPYTPQNGVEIALYSVKWGKNCLKLRCRLWASLSHLGVSYVMSLCYLPWASHMSLCYRDVQWILSLWRAMTNIWNKCRYPRSPQNKGEKRQNRQKLLSSGVIKVTHPQ